MPAQGPESIHREVSWTPRQREVLGFLAQGKSNPQIAEALGISLDGAKWHVSEVLSKLGVHSREEAAAYWLASTTPGRRLLRTTRRLAGMAALRWGAAVAAGVAVVAVAILLRGIGGDDEPPVVASPTVPGETATPAPSATVGPPPEMVGPLFAYSRDAGGAGRLPIREVVFHDLGAGKDAWSFQYGAAVEDEARSELVAGNRVVLATSAGVRTTNLYGGDERTLIEFAGGQRFWAMGVSTNNRYLAVSSSRDDGREWQIDVIDAGTGEIILSAPSTHTALDGFVGIPGKISWQPGDHAFAVAAATESEMHGDVATFGLDGTVRMWKTNGYPMLSPNGTRAAWTSQFAHDCYWDNPSLGQDLTLIDFVSGTEHALPLGQVGPVQWSPDSAWFFYDLYSPVPGSCDWVKSPVASMRVDFLSTASVSVPSRESTLREWNRDPLIEMDCGDGVWQLVERYRDGRRTGMCADGGKVRVNGIEAGHGASTTFFGFVSGPARPGDERVVIYERESDLTRVREVVAYTMATGEQRVLGGFDGPVDAEAGLVVTGSGRRVTVIDVTGQRAPYDLIVGEGLRTINDIALSPDGSLLAVAMGDHTADWNVDILRSGDGSLVARIDAASEAPIGPSDAYPGWLHWRADGRGVVVEGAVARDGSAGMLTFWVDGTVTRVEAPGFDAVSPDGRLAVVGIGSDETPECFETNSHDFRVIDLETLAVLAEVEDAERVFNGPLWDSASREVALRSYEPPFDEACAWTRQEPGSVSVDAGTGAVSDPGDPSPITASWSDASIRCDGEEQPLAFDRFFTRRGECPPGARTHELLAGGIVVDTAGASYELLGIVE